MIIFSILILILILLNFILLCKFIENPKRFQQYLEHYLDNWINFLIALISSMATSCALILALISVYLLKDRWNFSMDHYYNEQTTSAIISNQLRSSSTNLTCDRNKINQTNSEPISINVDTRIQFH